MIFCKVGRVRSVYLYDENPPAAIERSGIALRESGGGVLSAGRGKQGPFFEGKKV